MKAGGTFSSAARHVKPLISEACSGPTEASLTETGPAEAWSTSPA
jgi:hypothetical protein